MVISRALHASPDLNRSAPVFVTCSVAQGVPAAARLAATLAGRARYHAAAVSARRHFATTQRHLPHNCRHRRGVKTCDIVRPTTLRVPTSRTPLAVSAAVRQFFQQGHHRCISIDILVVELLLTGPDTIADSIDYHTCSSVTVSSVPVQLVAWKICF